MEWRDVVGYEGIYEVSDTGLVRTHKDKVTHSTRSGVRHWNQRVLKQKVSKDNCCRVSLYKNKSEKTWLVHRLVAIAFLPMQPGKEYVNHIDGNRLNNNLSNLEWCDHKENNNHAFDTGLMPCEPVILFNTKTKEYHRFRSMAKASEFLGRNPGYISAVLKNGKRSVKDYEIYRLAG